MGIAGELLGFFWQNKWWGLTPMVQALLFISALVIFAQSSAIAPLIYTPAAVVQLAGVRAKAFLVAGSLILTLLVAESFLLTFQRHFPTNLVPTRYVETVGVQNWPLYSGCYSREGFSCYSINAEGWRDVAHSFEKAVGLFRIAVVGDSYVEALQVDLEDTFWKRLEVNLNRRGHRVEVLAFGMSGFDAAQAHEALRHHALKYHPDLVIYAFVPGNDLRDSVRSLYDVPWKPYYVLDEGGTLHLDRSFVNYVRQQRTWFREAYRTIRNASRLLTFLELGMKEALSRRRSPRRHQTANTAATEPLQPEPGLTGSEIYRVPRPGSPYARAWRVTEELVLAMHRLAASRGAVLVVLGTTNGDWVYEARPRPDFDPFYSERRMEAFAKAHGLHYLPLAWKLHEAHREGLVFHGFGSARGIGHWNRVGHAKVADALTEFLLQEGLVR
jgi:hypothetical protein